MLDLVDAQKLQFKSPARKQSNGVQWCLFEVLSSLFQQTAAEAA